MINLVESKKSFNGFQKVFKHESSSNKSLMHFAVYEPDISKNCPVLYFLSGLTCTEQNFIQKSGFQQFASNYKIAVVVPDTSPRGKDIPDSDDFKLGQGAGFYINAANDVWSINYNMYDYITKELPQIIGLNFQFSKSKIGIFGHSFGGATSIMVAHSNSEIDAVFLLDAWTVPVPQSVIESGLNVPVIFMGQDKWNNPKNIEKLDTLLAKSSQQADKIILNEAYHFDFSDTPHFTKLSKIIGVSGKMKSDALLDTINTSIISFFNKYLNESNNQYD